MIFEFRQTRRVQFAETDLAGIVHFSNFFRYMEEVEHAFYRSLGFSVHDMPGDEPGSRVGWPRVNASCDYRQPLRFEDEFVVELLIEEIRNKTIVYQAGFRGGTDEDAPLAAVGRMIVVCVVFAEGGTMQSAAVPSRLRERIAAAPSERLFLREPELEREGV